MPARRKKNNSAAQIAQLINLLQNMQVPQQRQAPKRKRRYKKRASGASSVGAEGQVTLSRSELLGVLAIKPNTDGAMGHWDLIPDSMSFLKNVFKAFDRVRWNSLKFHYKPAVGTTYGGLVALGMDWDWASQDLPRERISAYTPSTTFAAWTDTEGKPLVLPRDKLMSRNWYAPRSADVQDRGPGVLRWAVKGSSENLGKTLGEVWVTYSVTMHGTNPA